MLLSLAINLIFPQNAFFITKLLSLYTYVIDGIYDKYVIIEKNIETKTKTAS